MKTKNLYRSTFGRGLVAAFFAVRKSTAGTKKAVVKVCEFDGAANAPVIRTKSGNLFSVNELMMREMGDTSCARVLKGTGNYARACFIARLVSHASRGGIYCPAVIDSTGKDYSKLMADQNRDNRAHNARIESDTEYRAECAHAELMKRGVAMRKAQDRYIDCEKFTGICEEEAAFFAVDNFGDDSFLG